MAMYKFPTKETEGETYFVQFDIFRLEPDKQIKKILNAVEGGYDQGISLSQHGSEAQQNAVDFRRRGSGTGDSAARLPAALEGLTLKSVAGNVKSAFTMENIQGMLRSIDLTYDYKQKASELLHSITLPLQMAPSENTKGNYNDEATRDVQTMMDIMSGKTPSFTRALALAQDETTDAISKTFNRLTNRATNQMQQTFYEGPSKRQYSFSFNLIPRNREDSKKIENIVRRFHYHASAGMQGEEFFEYPEMVRFLFLDKKGNPLKVFSHSGYEQPITDSAGDSANHTYESKSCFIEDVSVEYGMMGDNLRFKSANNPLDRGMGTAKLSISLRETEYFTKRDYRGTTLRGDI